MKNTIKALFICALIVLVGVALVKFVPSMEDELTDANAGDYTEQSTTQQTMIEISTSIAKQLLENAILNIVVEPQGTMQQVEIFLQSNEFIDEATLLMDTYNILQDITNIEAVEQFTFRWHMLVENKNAEVLTLRFSRDRFEQLHTSSYTQLPLLADVYRTHPALH